VSSRVKWIDATRGIAVLLVVLLHADIFAYREFVEGNPRALWEAVNTAAWPFLLAPLFMLAGLLRPTLLQQPAFSPAIRRAAGTSLWTYSVWFVVFAFAATAGLSTGVPPVEQPLQLLARFVLPGSVLWFLLALAFWTTLLPLVSRLPMSVLLSALTVLAVAHPWMPGKEGSDLYIRVLAYGLFFALGVYFSRQIRESVESGRVELLVVAAAIFAFASMKTTTDPMRDILAALSFPLQFSAAAIILMYVARFLVNRLPRVGSALAWYGERTLPIYTTHALLFFALKATPWWGQLVAGSLLMRWATPVLLVVAASLIGIAVHEVSQRVPPLRFLFALPQRRRRDAPRAVSRTREP